MAVRRKRFFAAGHALDRHRVTVPGDWMMSAQWVYPRECYERAGMFINDNFGAGAGRDGSLVRLVHGLYRSPRLPVASGHAWVDLGTGVVFAGVLQGFYDAAGGGR